jgi:hypothetical protein
MVLGVMGDYTYTPQHVPSLGARLDCKSIYPISFISFSTYPKHTFISGTNAILPLSATGRA